MLKCTSKNNAKLLQTFHQLITQAVKQIAVNVKYLQTFKYWVNAITQCILSTPYWNYYYKRLQIFYTENSHNTRITLKASNAHYAKSYAQSHSQYRTEKPSSGMYTLHYISISTSAKVVVLPGICLSFCKQLCVKTIHWISMKIIREIYLYISENLN